MQINHTDTLYLTSGSIELLQELERNLPDARAVIIGEDIPPLPVKGMLWCYVDWLLPTTSGLEICRRLREHPATREGHITMVLDGDDSEARRRTLRAGADDYVVGPIDAAKLIKRLRPCHMHMAPSRKFSKGDLEVDTAAFLARYRGRCIALAPNEFRLLAHFIENPDRAFSRSSLISLLGKDSGVLDERTVDVWIGRLRRALKERGIPVQLRTVRSVGYVFDSIIADQEMA
jgi:two-component system phosphate regulon response regulator PhoB